MSQLINPVVRFDFHMLSRRGGELPPGAVEFTSFSRVTSLYGRDEQVCSEPVSDSGQSSVDSEVMAARQCGGYARFPEYGSRRATQFERAPTDRQRTHSAIQ
jgi:hypothetical protein